MSHISSRCHEAESVSQAAAVRLNPASHPNSCPRPSQSCKPLLSLSPSYWNAKRNARRKAFAEARRRNAVSLAALKALLDQERPEALVGTHALLADPLVAALVAEMSEARLGVPD